MTKWKTKNHHRKEHGSKSKQRENPQNIPLFENVYEGMENADDKQNDYENENQNSTLDNILETSPEDVREEIQERAKNFGKKWEDAAVDFQTNNPIVALESQLGDTLDNLGNFQDFDVSSMAQTFDIGNLTNAGTAAQNVADSFRVDKRGIEKTMNEVTSSMKTLSIVFSNVFRLLGEKIRELKIRIQLIILYMDNYVKLIIRRMANALTQNSATQKEIDIFQQQTQKFITTMLVWYFVYNWYYIVFFLQDEDDIRYTFDGDKIKGYNTFLYGAFGPACRVVESFNWTILQGAKLKNYLPNAVIMLILFFVFFTLVNSNFQGSLLTDFFNAMRGQYSFSILSLISTLIVFRYSIGWFFGSVENGDLQMHSMVAKQQSIFAICFFLVLFIVTFMCYMIWTIAVNIPLAMFFITSYLVLYSFFGVFFYEGLGSFSIITGISNSIDQLEPDLRADSCKYNLHAPLFSSLWFKDMAKYLIEKAKTTVNFLTLSMFEILLLLMLLGGIGLYRKEWTASMVGKVSKGFMEPGSMGETFKQLFFWLIIINVLLIVLLCMFLYKKWNAFMNIGKNEDTVVVRSQEINLPSSSSNAVQHQQGEEQNRDEDKQGEMNEDKEEEKEEQEGKDEEKEEERDEQGEMNEDKEEEEEEKEEEKEK